MVLQVEFILPDWDLHLRRPLDQGEEKVSGLAVDVLRNDKEVSRGPNPVEKLSVGSAAMVPQTVEDETLLGACHRLILPYGLDILL